MTERLTEIQNPQNNEKYYMAGFSKFTAYEKIQKSSNKKLK